MKLLIVDDTALIRALVRQLLDELPFAVSIQEAADVAQALEILNHWTPDIVTLDLQLHEDGSKSGFDVLQAVRQAGLSSIVIVLTSIADARIRRACLEGGAQLVLDKSFEMHKLPDVLTALAGKHS